MGKLTLRAGLAALALTLAFTSNASADSVKDFKKAFGSTKNSWEKYQAIRLLDGNDKKAYGVLCKLLKTSDWYYRDAAINVLSIALDGENKDQIEKDLKKGKWVVAEAICLAIGKSSDSNKVPLLLEALKRKEWQVRRSAALALKELRDKRAIEPLMDAWENELRKGKQFRVWVRCIEALEETTGERELTALGDWRNWWEGAKSSFEVGGKKKKKEASSTVVRGVKLDYETRGKGGTLLVIPQYGFQDNYLKTYLRNLESHNRIIYAQLPGATDFKPALPNAPGSPSPHYPTEKISDALEALVKKLIEDKKIKKGKINIFAHGLSCWIAMKFASKYGKAVRRLVLCSPVSAQKAFGDGYDRHIRYGQKTGDLEETHWAQSNLYDQTKGAFQYVAQSQEERIALARKSFTLNFADFRDSEIKYILGEFDPQKGFPVHRPMGSVMIPPFDLYKLPKVNVKTLVIVGKHSRFTSVADCQGISKHYPGSKLMVFPKSSRMPFIEENTRFVKAMAKFLN